MCAHSLSAAAVTENITTVLYPHIRDFFAVLKRCSHHSLISKEATSFYDMIDKLKKEFESLSNYEEKLVFPSVLKVFNTKHDSSFKPAININELQRLVQGKENVIKEIVEELEVEADDLSLEKNHTVYQLIDFFQQQYFQKKNEWYQMLDGWNKGCACFIKAVGYANLNVAKEAIA